MFGFDSISQRTQTLSLWILLAFFGVKRPQGTKQHEKRLSQLTCSSVPSNFSSGPGSWRPPSFVAGHCPFLELGRILGLSIWIIARPSHSHLISDGTWYFWNNHIHRDDYWLNILDVMCVLKFWPTLCSSWSICSWSWLRGYCWEEKGWRWLWMIFFKQWGKNAK